MTRRKTIIKSLCAFAVFAVIAVLMAVGLPYNTIESEAVRITEADIQALKDKIKNNEIKINDTKKQLSALGGNIDNYIKIKEQLDLEISYLENNLEETAQLIDHYVFLIAQKEQQIAERETEIEERYALFLERLRVSYVEGTQNYLELLISSENLIDFITRADRLSAILTSEETMLKALEREVSDLHALKADLISKKTEYESLGVYQDEQEKQLIQARKEAVDTLAALQKDESKLQNMYQKYENSGADLREELDAMVQAFQKQKEEEAKAKLLWPLDPKWRTISSPYGYRWLYGVREFHLGVDIPAYAGSNIYAANSGKVEKAVYNSSYGYYILINHGNTYSTLYAHCSKLLVKQGDKVERGQVIGLVGTTGNSYGNHLHFEVRINGTKPDPVSGTTTNPLVKNLLVIFYNGKYVDPVAEKLLWYS
ncbi:MAG: hypothetical protein E7618_05390 [Ruminococcaceae bacterium]|nr:hypothetical protein [Oscillospiraceae bacterium]